MPTAWRSFEASLARGRHYFFHNLREIRKRKINYCLGFCSVWLVVLTACISLTSLRYAPFIFVSLAEANGGQIDLRIDSQFPPFNYTAISDFQNRPEGNPDYTWSSPRVEREVSYWLGKDCDAASSALDHPFWVYNGTTDADPCTLGDINAGSCLTEHCGEDARGQIVLFDTELEKRMELGRLWPYETLEPGEAILAPAGRPDVAAGDTVWVNFQLRSFLRTSWDTIKEDNGGYPTNHFLFPVTIKDVLPPITTYGKGAPPSENSYLYMEYSAFLPHIAQYPWPESAPGIAANLTDTDPYHHAATVIWNLPPSRLDPYLSPDYDSIQSEITSWASSLIYEVGFPEATNPDLPLLPEVQDYNILSLFLGLILNLVLIVLSLLSIILIYSLLMISVETRTFEMGVMRMVGLSRSRVIALLLVQSFFYSVPGSIAGLAVGQWIWSQLAFSIQTFGSIPIPGVLDLGSILWACSLGVFVPMAASIIPIRRALGINLQDSLDTRHGKATVTKVSIERAEDGNVNWTFIFIGLLLANLGFLIYYYFPLALLSFRVGLLLNIFIGLLLGMLFGLVLLGLNFQHLVERVILTVFLFWDRKPIREMVRKNLVAHKERNRKTALMYSLSLAFVLFVAVAYSIQIQTTLYREQRDLGTWVVLRFYDWRGSVNDPLPTLRDVAPQLEALVENTTAVVDWSWASFPLSWATTANLRSSGREDLVSNLGHVFSSTAQVHAVSPNFFKTAIPGYIKMETGFLGDEDYTAWTEDLEEGDDSWAGREVAPMFGLQADYTSEYQTLTDLLYTPHGSQSILGSATLGDAIGATPDQDMIIESSSLTQLVLSNYTRTRGLGFLSGCPWYRCSEFPLLGGDTDVFVSFPSYVRLAHGTMDSVEDIPIRLMFLQLDNSVAEGCVIDDNLGDDADCALVDDLITQLYSIVVGYPARVFDYRETSGPIAVANGFINIFFLFTLTVILCVCFFSLTSSMYSNIAEQTKEIAVLRAIGTPKSWIIRVYVYEGFILVMAASLVGIIVGALVAFTMSLQRSLFTQLPLPFIIPWNLVVLVSVSSLVFSIIAAYGPVTNLLRKTVVQQMRIVL